jgi:hypothetical protein
MSRLREAEKLLQNRLALKSLQGLVRRDLSFEIMSPALESKFARKAGLAKEADRPSVGTWKGT